MYMSVFCLHVSIPVHAIPVEVLRGVRHSNWSYRQLIVVMWVLRTKPTYS